LLWFLIGEEVMIFSFLGLRCRLRGIGSEPGPPRSALSVNACCVVLTAVRWTVLPELFSAPRNPQ
jgi:hypothetical protein